MSPSSGETRGLGRPRVIAYGIAVLVLALATPTFLLLDQRHQTRYRQWQAMVMRTDSANTAAEQRVRRIWSDLYQSRRGDEPTSAEAAQALGGAQSFPDDGQITYVDPASGGKAFLQFAHGRWTVTTPASWSESMPRRPPDESSYEIATFLRRFACLFVGYPFCGVLLLVLAGDWGYLDRRGRIVRSTDLLVASLFFLALSLLGPWSWRAWKEFFQDDSGGWGVLGAAVAATLLLTALLRRPAQDVRFCRNCRYDLTGNVSGVCPECGTVR